VGAIEAQDEYPVRQFRPDVKKIWCESPTFMQISRAERRLSIVVMSVYVENADWFTVSALHVDAKDTPRYRGPD